VRLSKSASDALCASVIQRIEHFGCTAVVGLVAKPIVDMLVEVTDMEQTKARIAPVLEAQGYDYFWRPTRGDDVPPFYAWFIKRVTELAKQDASVWCQPSEFRYSSGCAEVPMRHSLQTHYWDNVGAKQAFKNFILEIHGLDFTAWDGCGYWDEAYTPFSFFDRGRVVASVCIYLLDAVIEGRSTRLAQISGVGTLPQLRRKGLNRELTEIGLEWARGRHEGLFLFADEDAVPYYERCGFAPLVEHIEELPLTPQSARPGARRLELDDTNILQRIYDYAQRRAPVSDRFSVLNAKLVMFHVLNGLGQHAYEIPDLDCIAFFERTGGRVRLFDILAERIPTLDEIAPYLANEESCTLACHFHTSKLEAPGAKSVVLSGNNCHTRGTFPVDRPVFPYTSRA
jgi:GNAT superfamily N-acetyltransferase